MVTADQARVESVVCELVINAAAAMPAGGTVQIHLGREFLTLPKEGCPLPVPEGNYAVIAVTDTGGGISPEQLEMIFEPFYTTQPLHVAAGLGLAEVYGVVAKHGGGLAVQSTPEQGTRFTIYLPLAVPA